MGKTRSWCQFCRDWFERGDNIFHCSVCRKKFHKECLFAQGDLDIGSAGFDNETWKCESCAVNEGSETFENEERCKLCLEKEKKEKDYLLLCDGCPNSYHMSCLGLEAEPDSDKWYCPECSPDDKYNYSNVHRFNRNIITELQNFYASSGILKASQNEKNIEKNFTSNDDTLHSNSTICYVCQRPGQLLGCDFCMNSFHPTCLPGLNFDDISEKWECPLCKGEDPLRNQLHKRFTKKDMLEGMKRRQNRIKEWRRKCLKYRNKFLFVNKEKLKPFVDPKILNNLERSLKTVDQEDGGEYDSRSRLKKISIDDSNHDDYLPDKFDEQIDSEAQKFVRSVYRKCRYQSGKKIENIPLRDEYKLKKYQKGGVEWLLRSFLIGGAILADEMGLGKTIQTLCFLSYLNNCGIEGPHLIVVPLSTVGNWIREIHKFTPHLTHIKICGSKNEREHAMNDRLAGKGLYNLYVTTYETVKSEERFFTEDISAWHCIILDEAHRIKNQSGSIRHSMDRIRGNMRLLLTGTPLQNCPAELFTLINFMFPDICKNSHVLEQAFVGQKQPNKTIKPMNMFLYRDKMIDQKIVYDNKELESIRLLLEKVMLRRVKEQAIKLPKKIFQEIWMPLSTKSCEWYKNLLNIRSLQNIDRNMKTSFKKMLGLIVKMRIVCGHPRGIVSRDSQVKKLKAFYSEESEDKKEQISKDSELLKDLIGEEHIASSSKLIFVDKILCHLHYENVTFLPDYEESYQENRRNIALQQLHKKKKEENLKYKDSKNKENNDSSVEEKKSLKKRKNFSVGSKDDEELLKKLMLEGIAPKASNSRNGFFFKDYLYSSHEVTEKAKDCSSSDEQSHEDFDFNDDSTNLSWCSPKSKIEESLDNNGKEGSTGLNKSERKKWYFSDGITVDKTFEKNTKLRPSTTRKTILDYFTGPENSIVSIEDHEIRGNITESSTNPNCGNVLQCKYGNSESTELFDKVDHLRLKTINRALSKPNCSRSIIFDSDDEVISSKGDYERNLSVEEKVSSNDDFSSNSLIKHENNGTLINAQLPHAMKKICSPSDNNYVDGVSMSSMHKLDFEDNFSSSEMINLKNLVENDDKKKIGMDIDDDDPKLQKLDGIEEISTNEMELDPSSSGKTVDKESKERTKSEPKMHKVLIFTQFQLVLDELERYCKYRGWKYMRLDGSTNKLVRELDIREFNLPKNKHFVYLISTRAGGLGINLTAANHVVMYDEDWNPFVDLQAVDRAHRIGQNRDVHVWKLLTEWTVEERMFFRREQKLHLDKILINSQNHKMDSTNEEDYTEQMEEKLPADEVRKLMVYGKSAIEQMYGSTEELLSFTIEDFINRKRKPLPDSICNAGDNATLTDNTNDADDEKNLINVNEIMVDEAEELYYNKNEEDTISGLNENDFESNLVENEKSPMNDFEKNDSNTDTNGSIGEEACWRSLRERRKPANIYKPVDWSKKQEIRNIRHESRCFLCNKGRNFRLKVIDQNKNEKEVEFGDLYGCSRCPKSYHKICEGFKEYKKSFVCKWHECCMCFRKASQCGNLLIHCAKCPTSFCYDCFPPDYTRYHVSEDYYQNLSQKGVNLNSSNWILFLCSKCKAVEDQYNRRIMTREERENEKMHQRELRAQLTSKDNVKKAQMSEAARRRVTTEEIRKFIENKRRIDELYEKNEQRMRTLYQNFFPPKYLSELEKRIINYENQRNKDENAADRKSDMISPCQNLGNDKCKSKSDVSEQTRRSRRYTPFSLYLRMPSKSLNFCENCRLPCHNVSKYPDPCPFPSETKRKEVPVERAALKNSTPTSNTLLNYVSLFNKNQPNENNETIDINGNDFQVDENSEKIQITDAANRNSCDTDGALSTDVIEKKSDPKCDGKNSEVRNESTTSCKVYLRSACAKCGLVQKGKMSHSRKHCQQLIIEEKNEYQERWRLTTKLIDEMANKAKNINFSKLENDINFSLMTPLQFKTFAYKLINKVDSVLEECMRNSNLSQAISSKKELVRQNFGTRISNNLNDTGAKRSTCHGMDVSTLKKKKNCNNEDDTSKKSMNQMDAECAQKNEKENYKPSREFQEIKTDNSNDLSVSDTSDKNSEEKTSEVPIKDENDLNEEKSGINIKTNSNRGGTKLKNNNRKRKSNDSSRESQKKVAVKTKIADFKGSAKTSDIGRKAVEKILSVNPMTTTSGHTSSEKKRNSKNCEKSIENSSRNKKQNDQ